MKKINTQIVLSGLIAVFCLLFGASCKTNEITPVTESVKDLTGTWRVTKATRNGTNLFSLLDTTVYSFSKFTIAFKSGSYTLSNALPFIVNQNGTYSLDNPQYPFQITFTQTGSTAPVATSFTYPIVNGQRVLTLVFSPGCTQNTYSYSLEKISN
jgi:hypothetical protein